MNFGLGTRATQKKPKEKKSIVRNNIKILK